jgi:gamma-glutamylcyclotransferase (GGCT)/AIG2-like uncharacterized protein YtfP
VTVLLAVYGSLRRGLALPYQPPGFDRLLADRQPCLVPGRLVDLGAYPGLVEGTGQVVADLCRLPDEASLEPFDAFESYHPDRPEASQYLRVMVRLVEPQVDAWTYRYNRAWTPEMLVPSGDWHHHLLSRSG